MPISSAGRRRLEGASAATSAASKQPRNTRRSYWPNSGHQQATSQLRPEDRLFDTNNPILLHQHRTKSTSTTSIASTKATDGAQHQHQQQNQHQYQPAALATKSNLVSFQRGPQLAGGFVKGINNTRRADRYKARNVSSPISIVSASSSFQPVAASNNTNRADSLQQDANSGPHQHQHQLEPETSHTQSSQESHNHNQRDEDMNSLSGQMVVTGKQPASMPSDNNHANRKATTNMATASATSSPTSKLGAGFLAQYNPVIQTNSQASLHNQQHQLQSSTNSSTAHLHSLADLHQQASHHHNHHHNHRQTLNISKKLNLKHIKTIIIALMAIDLLITLFVHHFAAHDELPTLPSIWFLSGPIKMRLSVLNLVLSSIWFIVLIGAILFDVYSILVLACLVDAVSFLLLLVCSILHFSRRIDYNTVNLASLLALLFSIIVLHVYLLVMAALTIYLALAVRRRRKAMR